MISVYTNRRATVPPHESNTRTITVRLPAPNSKLRYPLGPYGTQDHPVTTPLTGPDRRVSDANNLGISWQAALSTHIRPPRIITTPMEEYLGPLHVADPVYVASDNRQHHR
ncbi:Hypothetical predicted protein [Pelobates cultripes]|uniref:Uncharacterized protein n=1 Tax=Pelobates cultripes TaxID=61616 RepID=A0AAD1QZ91_PELCU|nr:Hypothetical predicted protein [Pelobates cultripes]